MQRHVGCRGAEHDKYKSKFKYFLKNPYIHHIAAATVTSVIPPATPHFRPLPNLFISVTEPIKCTQINQMPSKGKYIYYVKEKKLIKLQTIVRAKCGSLPLRLASTGVGSCTASRLSPIFFNGSSLMLY